MLTKRGQGGQFQPQHRWCFTRQLVQTKERGVYGEAETTSENTKSGY